MSSSSNQLANASIMVLLMALITTVCINLESIHQHLFHNEKPQIGQIYYIPRLCEQSVLDPFGTGKCDMMIKITDAREDTNKTLWVRYHFCEREDCESPYLARTQWSKPWNQIRSIYELKSLKITK